MYKNCSFCEKSVISEQEIFCGNKVRLIYPRKPVITESLMIMPIRCVENFHDLTEEEFLEVFEFVKKLRIIFLDIFGTKDYNLFINNGIAAGQHIPHVHFYFYGRKENEKINLFKILNDSEKYKNRPEIIVETKKMLMADIRERLSKK